MSDDVLRRLTRLEDLEEIRGLAVRYGFAVDDRDFAAIEALFARDATLRTAAGRIKGGNRDEVVGYFRTHMTELGPTNHFTHGHVVEFESDTVATGTVSSHAEVWRNGTPMVTAMRYLDRYVKTADGWRFADRVQTYMYFVDVREYPEALGAELRIRASENWQPGDWPRLLPSAV